MVGVGLGKGRGEVAFFSGFILGVGLGTGSGVVIFLSSLIIGVGIGKGRSEIGFLSGFILEVGLGCVIKRSNFYFLLSDRSIEDFLLHSLIGWFPAGSKIYIFCCLLKINKLPTISLI